ncbi:phenylacetate--CoA ligase family protein [Rugosimonospora africana]|uniref:Phenylacetate-coenzyme A ligase n=1 Tax=Rugosimonospora africana TaxID=556532 RepID=A0A8J3R4N1_9ACTN|nr:phenylacetate--CoA ligase [Rugosimonospora africana]GIH19971.1 phenylacetate-coenzyme A ligase [Rugosimonospora africana]
MIFDPAETMSVDERGALQTRRLRALVDRLLADGGRQAGLLREAGVERGGELTLDDLPGLPTVSKPDLWDAYPFGMLAVPLEDCVTVHGSSGTSGRPTLVPYTAHDLDLWAHVMARGLAGAGATRASIVHNAYGYGLFTGGLGVDHGARALGATVIPMSSGNTARQLRLIQDLRPDVLTCTPSYAIYLAEAARAEDIDPTTLGIRVGVHGAEPWTEAMREQIELLLGIRALDIYGLSEVIGPGVACESLDSGGWLHVQEDHFFVEALDPATGLPVPEGELGELTFTTFTKEAFPLLRYRTGDLARLSRKPSPDGRTTVKMSKVVGRSDDMLVIRGVNVYPSEVEAVVLADAGVGPQYAIVVDARATLPRLVVCCEPSAPGVDGLEVGARLHGALARRLGLGCEVRVVEPGTLPRTEVGKARRVIRWDAGPAPLPGVE